MLLSIEKIIKILKLEKKRNFDNRSVMGGLDKYSESFKLDAINEGIPSQVIKSITDALSNYHFLSKDERKSAIETLLDELLEKKTTQAKPLVNDYSELIKFQNQKTYKESDKFSQASKIYEIETALANPVIKIPGIGKSKSIALSKLGINTIKDLLYFFPRKHEDFSNFTTINKLSFGESISLAANVKSFHTHRIKGGKQSISEVILEDGTGTLRIIFFNQPFLEKSLQPGTKIMVSGKVEMYKGRFVLNNPEWIDLGQEKTRLNRLYPYYPLTKSITQKWMREMISGQLNLWVSRISDFFSSEFCTKAEILPLSLALQNIHYPENLEMKKKAEYRFSFQDTFFLHLLMLTQKKEWQKQQSKKIVIDTVFLNQLEQSLPYSLTNAQKKCINEINKDLSSGVPMSRLIQGDVGSGKTIVSVFAIASVIKDGFQAAVMAPTGILAEQLHKNIRDFLTKLNIITNDEICFLTGDTPEKVKVNIRAGLASGKIRVAVGTHALLEDSVKFNKLELVVIDEQHRFGVMQRKKIRSKGSTSHLLVMTATPIPRTLALTIYGDLELSIIDELPPGRKEIITKIIPPREKEEIYSFVRDQIKAGYQAFVVYPLVESDLEDLLETNAAVNEYNRLKKDIFPDLTIGLLHGKMKAEQKENIMQAFREKKYQILISTTVIEVGVDIPNASIMLIEGANRFGLSQLHQLRGRVGRGASQSFCFLIPENDEVYENERLNAMIQTTDGFKLAEIDLLQRGPGDFIGVRQSGFKEIRFSTIMNGKLIDKVRRMAQDVILNEPNLINNNPLYKIIMSEYLQKMIGEKN